MASRRQRRAVPGVEEQGPIPGVADRGTHRGGIMAGSSCATAVPRPLLIIPTGQWTSKWRSWLHPMRWQPLPRPQSEGGAMACSYDSLATCCMPPPHCSRRSARLPTTLPAPQLHALLPTFCTTQLETVMAVELRARMAALRAVVSTTLSSVKYCREVDMEVHNMRMRW